MKKAKEFFNQKRKAGLVNVITETLVKDAAPEVTEGKMEPAKRAKVLSEIDRAPTLKFSKTSIFQAETNLEKILSEGFNDYATETNKKWPALFKSLGIVNLNLNDKAQREKFLEDLISTEVDENGKPIPGLASKFPKSFWRNFQGTSTSVSEMRGDVKFYKMQDGSFAPGVLVKGKDGKTKYKAPKNAFRKYASHVFFLNVADAKAWIEKAESKGIKFPPESDMFKDLLYKEPYTQKVNKKRGFITKQRKI